MLVAVHGLKVFDKSITITPTFDPLFRLTFQDSKSDFPCSRPYLTENKENGFMVLRGDPI